MSRCLGKDIDANLLGKDAHLFYWQFLGVCYSVIALISKYKHKPCSEIC